MDKSVLDIQINKKPLISQPSSSNNQSNYKIPQIPVSKKAKYNEESNKNNIDYKNISLTITGEISSGYIHRNSLTQKQPNITFIADTKEDDEQFILNIKTIIDNKMQNKENFSIRDLQSKSYLSRKKKCVFNDEDQNLMKRFKKSVEESKVSCIVPQKLQQPDHVSVSNHNCSTTYTPQITPVVKFNESDMNFKSNTNEPFFNVALKAQKNDQLINGRTSENIRTDIEIEFDQLVYHEIQYFTPPWKDDL